MTDTDEGNLAAWLLENTALRGPVLETLAGNSDDSALELRLKNALIGAGLGVVADTMFGALRALRTGRTDRLRQEASTAVDSIWDNEFRAIRENVLDDSLDRQNPLVRQGVIRALQQIDPKVSQTVVRPGFGREIRQWLEINEPATTLSPLFAEKIDDIGDIGLGWGEPIDPRRFGQLGREKLRGGSGISHVIARRFLDDGLNAADVERVVRQEIPNVLANGRITDVQFNTATGFPNRVILETATGSVTLSTERSVMGISGVAPETFLISGYDLKSDFERSLNRIGPSER